MKNKGLAFLGYLILLCGIVLLFLSIDKVGDNPPPVSSAAESGSAAESSEVSNSYMGDISGGIIAEGDYNSVQLFSDSAVCYNVTSRKYNLMKAVSTSCAPGDFCLLMTALTAVDEFDESAVFIVTNELELVPEGAKLSGLKYGDMLDLPTMLDAILVERAADAAYVIAIATAKKISGDTALSDADALKLFVARMNSTATKLAMTGTKFINPCGTYDKEQVTTAADICKAAAECRGKELICKSVAKKEATHVLQNGGTVEYTNNNKLLDSNMTTQFYTYADGMLAWQLDEGLYCLIASAVIGQTDVIAVLVGADLADETYADAQALFYPILSKTVFSTSSEAQ